MFSPSRAISPYPPEFVSARARRHRHGGGAGSPHLARRDVLDGPLVLPGCYRSCGGSAGGRHAGVPTGQHETAALACKVGGVTKIPTLCPHDVPHPVASADFRELPFGTALVKNHSRSHRGPRGPRKSTDATSAVGQEGAKCHIRCAR